MPPFHTLSLQDHSDYVLLAVYFAIAIVTGTLTAQLRRQRGVLQIRERRASTLYRLSKALAVADSVPEIEKIASSQLFDLIGAPVKLLIKHASEDRLESSTELGAKEHAVADWVLKNAKPAGKFTETLPAAAGSYFPLTTQQQAWGVLALVPLEKRLSPEMRILVESVCGQIALAVQKERLRAKSHLADLAGESDRLSRSLLNVVSHELKTPITAILSAAQSLENRQSSLSDRERELFASVAENGRRLSRIVDHLLETNRLEAGKIEVRREAVDLHDVVAATLRRLGHELEGRSITCDLPTSIPLLETDEVLLATVLRNLLHNAAFHTPPGSPIQLVVEIDDKRVILKVLDEGPGFASDESEKLFEKFYRGANAQPGGTGLGLPLARGLAESLGGTLVARNRSPKGSEFELTLPLRTPR
jgi:two-component system, OmpR family, sensor histidine kinase KdpD